MSKKRPNFVACKRDNFEGFKNPEICLWQEKRQFVTELKIFNEKYLVVNLVNLLFSSRKNLNAKRKFTREIEDRRS